MLERHQQHTADIHIDHMQKPIHIPTFRDRPILTKENLPKFISYFLRKVGKMELLIF